MRRRLITEVVLILAVTFGTSGIRAVLRLVDSLLTAPLNEQSTTLIDTASTTTWLDLALVVVMYLLIRLRQLGWKPWQAIAASSVLRGSYHLYQGVSAGVGNLVMGLVFAYYFHRGSRSSRSETSDPGEHEIKRVWPLVIAHFLIDAVAYIAYPLLDLSFLGI